MRIIIFILGILISANAFSQNPSFFTEGEPLVKECSCDKSEIWQNLQLWLSEYSDNNSPMIKFSDETKGILEFEFITPRLSNQLEFVSFQSFTTYRVDIKDNKYKIKLVSATINADKSVAYYSLSNNDSYSRLTFCQNQLGALIGLIQEEFSSSPDWNMLNNYLKIRDKYKELSEAERPVKNKNKMPPNTIKYNILQDALIAYVIPNLNLLNALVEAIDNKQETF